MTLHVVRCDQVEPQSWCNGGGRTRELLAWPNREDWSLRISVADIDQDGPFSPYPGVDRWFVVLRGEGVVLRFDEVEYRLAPGSDTFAFDGGRPPACHLLGGRTQDLNLMVRRGTGMTTRALAVLPGPEFSSAAPWRALFCACAGKLHGGPAGAIGLAAHTLCWSDCAAGQIWRWHPDEATARAWWVDFSPPDQAAG